MSKDIIYREDAIDVLQYCPKHCFDPFCGYHISIEDAEAALVNLPSAQSDVPDRNVGKWIVSKSDTGKLKTKCSVCGATYSNYLRLIMNYCPNCGAKMEG